MDCGCALILNALHTRRTSRGENQTSFPFSLFRWDVSSKRGNTCCERLTDTNACESAQRPQRLLRDTRRFRTRLSQCAATSDARRVWTLHDGRYQERDPLQGTGRFSPTVDKNCRSLSSLHSMLRVHASDLHNVAVTDSERRLSKMPAKNHQKSIL